MIGYLRFTVENFEVEFAKMKKYMESYIDMLGVSSCTCSIRQSEEKSNNVPTHLYVDLLIENKKFSTLTFEATFPVDGIVNYLEQNGELSESEKKLLFYIYNYRPE